MKKKLFVLAVLVCLISPAVNAAIDSVTFDVSDPLSFSMNAEQYFISCDIDIRVSENDTALIADIFDWDSFASTETFTGYMFGEREIEWLVPAAIINTLTLDSDSYANVTCTATSPQSSVYKSSEMFSVSFAEGWGYAGLDEPAIATIEIYAKSIDSFQTAGDYSDVVIGSFTVVPEPFTLGLLSVGGLAVLRRRG